MLIFTKPLSGSPSYENDTFSSKLEFTYSHSSIHKFPPVLLYESFVKFEEKLLLLSRNISDLFTMKL